MSEKEFIDYNKQLEILGSKHIGLDNRKLAKKALIDHGMYNIVNAYKDPFLRTRDPEEYLPGIQFSEIYTLHNADLLLQSSFTYPMTIIESKLKAALAFEISKKYGKDHNNYLTLDTFYTGETTALIRAQKLIAFLTRKIADQTATKYSNPVKHYNEKYHFVPMWVLTTTLTFGNISEMYSCLKHSEQVAISRRFNFTPKELESVIKFINIIRNKCAHHNRLYCHKNDTKSSFPIPVLSIHKELDLPKKGNRYTVGITDMLACLIVFRHFLSRQDFRRLLWITLIFSRYIRAFINPLSAQRIMEVTGLDIKYLNKLKKL